MAGGHMKFRTLGRKSSHRQALLRNLVTTLINEETIRTTWPKAKEAQRMAEKLITLAKRNNETARRSAQGILYTPHDLMPKLFGELRERYAERQGGYTRVLRTEVKDKYDQAPSAILALVDGPKDMRFAMTAAAVAMDKNLGKPHTPLTELNMMKVTRFRKNGEAEFNDLVERLKKIRLDKQRPDRDQEYERGEREPKRPSSYR